MVVRLLKRCQRCWFSFTSRLTLYYCVASPTVAAGTHRRHRQNSAPSAASYLPREKETVYAARNRTAKKQARAVQYLVVVSVSSFPSLLFICWWGAKGSGGRTESENVNCQLLSNEWRRLSWSSFSANNVVVL